MTTAMNEAEKLADKLDSSDANFYGESSLWFDSDLSDAVSDAASILRRQAEQIKLLREALERCADWMERLRASGDAGHWDWNEDDDYTQARSALAATKEET